MLTAFDVKAALPQASIARPATLRLHALARLDEAAVLALQAAAERPRVLRPQQELIAEGQPITEAVLFLEGWAARVRQLADGRRAIMNFLLPGDLIGFCEHDRPVASSTVVAMTRVVVCAAPEHRASPALDRAYAISRATEEAHLLSQITRLSRLNASERLYDLLLELLERLELAGLAVAGRYEFPVTQEVIGDALGLSTVHVNRTIQQARRAGDLTWSGQRVAIADPEGLREAIGRHPVRVTALRGG